MTTYILFRNVATPFFTEATIVPPLTDGPIPPLVIGSQQTFQLSVNSPNVVSVSATAQIVVSNDTEPKKNWAALGNPLVVSGTASASIGFNNVGNWAFFSGYLTAISGTGALATLVMDEGNAGGGSSSASAATVVSGTTTLGAPGNYVFNGTLAATWTLPALSVSSGPFYLKNRGTVALTIIAAGTDQFYDSEAIGKLVLLPGCSIILIGDSLYWTVQ